MKSNPSYNNKPSINYIILSPSKDLASSANINRISCFQIGLGNLGYKCTVNKIYSRFLDIKGFSRLGIIICYLKIIFPFIKSKRGDYFIFYGESPFGVLFKYFRTKVKIIVERNEYSSYIINQHPLSNNYIRYVKRFESSLQHIDGFITCSEALKKYYINYLNPLTECKILPLIVDLKLFNMLEKDKKVQNYIAYCGNFDNNKDGIPILIDAFKEIVVDFSEIKLFLIGGGEFKQEQILHQKIIDLGLGEKVIFTGKISHEQIPNLLGNAKLLTLARPSNKQAEGGIPSKIGEYLACGVPFVVTKVGELDRFLRDEENCYMAEPNSVEDFAKKMKQALNDKNSEIIAQNGRITAKQFGIENQTQLLIQFLLEI